ncbi:MAG: hypothetical protein WCJ39_00155 [bacterium]
MQKTGITTIILLWLISTITIGNTSDSLNNYRISVGKYSEDNQLLALNRWTVQFYQQILLPSEKTSIHINGFFLSQEGLQVVVYKGLHTAVFRQIEDSASTFSNILIRDMLEQILQNTSSVEGAVQKFWDICQSAPTLYISGGESIKFSLECLSSIGLSIGPIRNVQETPSIVQWYSMDGKLANQHSLPRGSLLIKVSTFSSGETKVEKIIFP